MHQCKTRTIKRETKHTFVIKWVRAVISGLLLYTTLHITTMYRHVILPKELKKLIPKKLMNEAEWRSLGVQQSYGWVHYMLHAPELHVLCFKRELGTAMIP